MLILSHGFGSVVESALTLVGIREFFTEIIGSDSQLSLQFSGSKVKILSHWMKSLEVKPLASEVLFVDDDIRNIIPARSDSVCRTFWVWHRQGLSQEELKRIAAAALGDSQVSNTLAVPTFVLQNARPIPERNVIQYFVLEGFSSVRDVVRLLNAGPPFHELRLEGVCISWSANRQCFFLLCPGQAPEPKVWDRILQEWEQLKTTARPPESAVRIRPGDMGGGESCPKAAPAVAVLQPTPEENKPTIVPVSAVAPMQPRGDQSSSRICCFCIRRRGAQPRLRTDGGEAQAKEPVATEKIELVVEDAPVPQSTPEVPAPSNLKDADDNSSRSSSDSGIEAQDRPLNGEVQTSSAAPTAPRAPGSAPARPPVVPQLRLDLLNQPKNQPKPAAAATSMTQKLPPQGVTAEEWETWEQWTPPGDKKGSKDHS